MTKNTFIITSIFICTLAVITSCKKDITGCTNPKAENYNPDANIDGGDCIIKGCTNPKAENYDPEATADDGFCLIKGCTNPKAENYDPEANVDDGSCKIKGCLDPQAINYNPSANVSNDSCVYLNSRFIGTYKGNLDCTNQFLMILEAQELTFVFEEIPGAKDRVNMRLEGAFFGNQNIEGKITDKVLTYQTPKQQISIDVNGDGNPEMIEVSNFGTFTTLYPAPELDGKITLNVKLTFGGFPLEINDTCTIKAKKQ
jgi:hypothetical protein